MSIYRFAQGRHIFQHASRRRACVKRSFDTSTHARVGVKERYKNEDLGS